MTKFTKIAAIAAFAFAFTFAIASAAVTVPPNLMQGSSGTQVMNLQSALGIASDGAFGPMTKAAVMAFQTGHSLTVDGIVGPMTAAAINLMNAESTGSVYPAGCTSSTGYSSTTGMSCAMVSTLPAGCTSTSGFSTTTGMSCATVTTLPAGCTSTVGYSPTTGAKCDSGTTGTPSGPLMGGAGNATIADSSVDTESEVSEGTTEKVAGMRIEASGSDLAISNVQVTLTNLGSGSTWLSRYASEVSIWMGDTKVGSLPVSSFSQSGTNYTGNIAVSNAVVREGAANRQYFYVGLTANNTLDSGDVLSDAWKVTVDNVRYSDATGVVLTTTYSPNTTTGISFETLSTSGSVKATITKNSSNPLAGNVEVSDTSSTSDVVLLAFNVKAEGTDISVDSMKFTLTTSGATPTAIASLVSLWDGSSRIGEISSLGASGASNTINLDSTLIIPKDSTKTLTLKAKINQVATTTGAAGFDQGDSMQAQLDSLSGLLLDATGSAIASGNISGSAIGEAQAFYSEGLNASNFSSSYVTTSNSTTGAVTKQTYTVSFKLTAFGNTYYIPQTVVRDTRAGEEGLLYTIEKSDGTTTTAGANVINSSASSLSSSDASVVSGYYEIPDGETKTFSATIELTKGSSPAAGFYRIQLGSVLYDLNQTSGGTDDAIYTFAPSYSYETADAKIDL